MAGETTQHDYVVLARKYRSRTFGELIGQDALVRTLTNAIAANKIHHAYVLTGIRGTGKTSTARLLAMALNCENGPSVTWAENDPQVEAIRTGRHVDVFEFDAASNRSVEDVQKLFEGVNYAPIAGRFKVYIIDEVHMLSTTAFNALLKTLEEPPAQVKFIFATTDVQKIPLTVLSRCQRFDLKRIPSEVLAAHFTEILKKEGLEAEPAAITMIARAADGSVRDGLSLLDQAIALSNGVVQAATVEGMLGVADRARVFDLLETLVEGKTPAALAIVDELYSGGTDALGVVQGLLELAHVVTRIKIVPGLGESAGLTELERTRAVPLAGKVAMASLGRLYQMLVQALSEVKLAERPYEALSMACVRVAYLAPLPGMDKLLSEAHQVVQGQVQAPESASVGAARVSVREEEEARDLPVVSAGLVGTEKDIQVGHLPQDWAGVVKLVAAEKPALAAALERQVRCEGLEGNHLKLAFSKGLMAGGDMVRDLRTVLRQVTGVAWQIDEVEAGKGLNLAEQRAELDAARHVAAAEDPTVVDVMAMFPGAELERVEEMNG
jgi:DNA polymerase-3 subunit gamma/tau